MKYEKSGEVESEGRTLYVTACDPEFYDEIVEDCTVRVAIGDDEAERDGKTMSGADEHAIEAWLHGTYYPWALELRMEDARDAHAEAQFDDLQDRAARGW